VDSSKPGTRLVRRELCETERGRLAEIPGEHFFFLVERARTTDEMRAFLDTLGRSEP
jgi:hypothetical protein